MTGVKTISSHISPLIRNAAAKAGRASPRIVCSLPVTVTKDVQAARLRINEELAVYATLPSYAAMMEREGAKEPADVALLGSKDEVLERLDLLHDAKVTEFSGVASGTSDERDATRLALLEYAKAQ
jgi:alkanesulfonate monooxygenase SsuD/methylene tetrahydromethanopterin reductase-like flavin-dependent oxidoreductase (luciferase family)